MPQLPRILPGLGQSLCTNVASLTFGLLKNILSQIPQRSGTNLGYVWSWWTEYPYTFLQVSAPSNPQTNEFEGLSNQNTSTRVLLVPITYNLEYYFPWSDIYGPHGKKTKSNEKEIWQSVV